MQNNLIYESLAFSLGANIVYECIIKHFIYLNKDGKNKIMLGLLIAYNSFLWSLMQYLVYQNNGIAIPIEMSIFNVIIYCITESIYIKRIIDKVTINLFRLYHVVILCLILTEGVN